MCAAAAPHVKVCLSGQGGDELFAGYNVFQFAARLERMLERVPGAPPAPVGAAGQIRRLPARHQYNWYLRGLAGAVAGADPALLLDVATPLFSPRRSAFGLSRSRRPTARRMSSPGSRAD